MSLSGLFGEKHTCGLDDVVGAASSPTDISGVSFRKHGNFLTIDNELSVSGADLAFETTMNSIVLGHVDHVVQIDEGVVNTNDFHVTTFTRCTKRQPSNSSKPINTDFDCHNARTSFNDPFQ